MQQRRELRAEFGGNSWGQAWWAGRQSCSCLIEPLLCLQTRVLRHAMPSFLARRALQHMAMHSGSCCLLAAALALHLWLALGCCSFAAACWQPPWHCGSRWAIAYLCTSAARAGLLRFCCGLRAPHPRCPAAAAAAAACPGPVLCSYAAAFAVTCAPFTRPVLPPLLLLLLLRAQGLPKLPPQNSSTSSQDARGCTSASQVPTLAAALAPGEKGWPAGAQAPCGGARALRGANTGGGWIVLRAFRWTLQLCLRCRRQLSGGSARNSRAAVITNTFYYPFSLPRRQPLSLLLRAASTAGVCAGGWPLGGCWLWSGCASQARSRCA